MELGIHRSELQVSRHPSGRGSAKQWIEERYLEEVRIHRSKANHQQVALLVGTDADEQTVNQRTGNLAAVLKDAKVDPRSKKEQNVHWIPKWNAETWILYLSGQDVDEDDKDCKQRVSNPDYKQVAAAFVEQFRAIQAGESIKTLPSLEVAYRETQRFEL